MLRQVYNHEIEAALEGTNLAESSEVKMTARLATNDYYLPMFDDRCVIVKEKMFCRTKDGLVKTFEAPRVMESKANGLNYTDVLSVASGEVEWRRQSVPVEPLEDCDELEIMIRFSNDNTAVFSNRKLFKTKYLLTDGLGNPDYPCVSGKNVAFLGNDRRYFLLRSYSRLRYTNITI